MAFRNIDNMTIGLPTHWSEMGITDEQVLRAATDTCFITPAAAARCRAMRYTKY